MLLLGLLGGEGTDRRHLAGLGGPAQRLQSLAKRASDGLIADESVPPADLEVVAGQPYRRQIPLPMQAIGRRVLIGSRRCGPPRLVRLFGCHMNRPLSWNAQLK